MLGEQIVVYTDGSCLGNPGAGGWAFIVVQGGEKKSFTGGEKFTTNNKMELTAAIKALDYLNSEGLFDKKIVLFTDSMYVKNGITSWIFGWMKNGWRNSQGKAVENADFWKELYSLSQKFKLLEWQWTKAHSKDVLNNEVDKLAREAAAKFSGL
ncbi:MAG: hypothetical protein RL208_107 [Pseudomonadota bacterium]|jgi:ribonuclease HI